MYSDGPFFYFIGVWPLGDLGELRGAVEWPRVEAAGDLYVRYQIRLGDVQPGKPDHYRLFYGALPNTVLTSLLYLQLINY